MTDSLPVGWATTTLDEVGHWQSGGTPSRRNPAHFGNDIPWVKSGDLPDGPILSTEEHLTEVGLRNSSAKLMPTGTISMALYGATIGKLGVLTFPAATNQACVNVVTNTRLMERQYLFWYLLSERKAFVERGQGGAQPNISQQIVRGHPIRIAPLNEQRRIVAKLEKLLDKVDSCQKRLAKIPILLKRFRQAVLAAACSGQLTADWREENKIGEDFEQTTIEVIASYLGGFAYSSRTFLDQGPHQVIRIGNVRPFSLKLDSSPVYISDSLVVSTERFRLLPDDIVISMTGTKYKQDYGFAALVRASDGSLFLNQRVGRLRCGDRVVPKFLLLWLQGEVFRNYFFSGETGNVNQGNVGADAIRKALVDLPSLREQEEIVRRVDRLFGLVDQIEARYAKAKEHVDSLKQSILAKAFRGELVPQDPNDEPADVLLERIREARTTQPPHPSRRKVRNSTLNVPTP